jgi:protease I
MAAKEQRIILLVDHDFEDLELHYPLLRLQEEGANVDLVGPQQHETYKGKKGLSIRADQGYAQIDPGEAGRPIGQICHAGWVLVSAGIANGRRLTSTPGIKDDMINAGAEWVDASCVVDGNLVSSRRPYDLPDMMPELIKLVKEPQYA